MIKLEAAKLLTKSDAHPYLKEMLSFPDYYGNNLDALFDCLTDLGPTQVCIAHAGIGGSYLEKVLRVFKDARKANPDLEVLITEGDAPSEPEEKTADEQVFLPNEMEVLREEPEEPDGEDDFWDEEDTAWDEDQEDLRLLDGSDDTREWD